MSIHFHKLRIKQIRKETADCVSILFDVPESIKEEFAFHQGQSLTVRTFINGEEIRRTYSICSSPLENEWRVAVKKVDGGQFSTYANEVLREGDSMEVMPPVGKFYTELDPKQQKHYVAFAAGSGITPVISLVKTTLELEPKSSFTLVFGNRATSSIIFFEELEGLKNRYVDRFNLIHVLSREQTESPVNSGRIDVKKLELLDRVVGYETADEFFLCGPEQMIFCIKQYLENRGIDKRKIHFELFTTPGVSVQPAAGSPKSPVSAKQPSGPKSRIGVKLDGRMFEFELSQKSNTTILDAALQQGADLPFACKGGVCTTCKARLLEGRVRMDVHWGLEDEEIQKGFILTCQSHPTTEKVVVDFDIK